MVEGLVIDERTVREMVRLALTREGQHDVDEPRAMDVEHRPVARADVRRRDLLMSVDLVRQILAKIAVVVQTGELVWRFYTVPNPSKAPDNAASDSVYADLANDTWGNEGEWVTDGGGGTVWDSIVYDAVNDTVVFGVGNGSPWKEAGAIAGRKQGPVF